MWPTPLIAEYYRQRASAGLILTEASPICSGYECRACADSHVPSRKIGEASVRIKRPMHAAIVFSDQGRSAHCPHRRGCVSGRTSPPVGEVDCAKAGRREKIVTLDSLK